MSRVKYKSGYVFDSGITLLERLPDRGYKVLYKCGHTKTLINLPLSARSGLCSNCVSSQPTTLLHGNSPRSGNTRVYNTWLNMKRRCNSPSNNRYYRYEGRGIKVCERWLESFSNFLEDMGEPPEGYTIDRIDNDGNYTPENCRWADSITQSKDKCNTLTIKHKITGNTYSLRNLCEVMGIDYKNSWRKIKQEGKSLPLVIGSDDYEFLIK